MQVTKNIKPRIVEERGIINIILDVAESREPIRSVMIITSKTGSTRSNHYHKKDSHYCYLMSGKMEWHEKPVDGGEAETQILEAGDMVFTPPMMIHAARFLEDSVMLAFSTLGRDQMTGDEYEADTVRVKLIE